MTRTLQYMGYSEKPGRHQGTVVPTRPSQEQNSRSPSDEGGSSRAISRHSSPGTGGSVDGDETGEIG